MAVHQTYQPVRDVTNPELGQDTMDQEWRLACRAYLRRAWLFDAAIDVFLLHWSFNMAPTTLISRTLQDYLARSRLEYLLAPAGWNSSPARTTASVPVSVVPMPMPPLPIWVTREDSESIDLS